jgi:transmembrane sensor
MKSEGMPERTGSTADHAQAAEEAASQVFVQRLYGEWNEDSQTAFEARLAGDRDFAQAFRRVEASWCALDRHAAAPELMKYRANAIETLRRANARRWFQTESLATPVAWLAHHWKIAAAVAGLAVFGAAWQFSPFGYRPGEYRTAIGEQRVIELKDHTRIAIDAATRLQVRYTNDARTVRLLEGQAQFSVAKDPLRPFKVIAGGRTIVAVGTVFTVEYVAHRTHVAMVEGKVAVLNQQTAAGKTETASAVSGGQRIQTPARQESEIYLAAGEELHATDGGRTVVTPEADIEAATAWREGKVIFHSTPLSEAVSRMNRYSHLQIQIDDRSLGTQYVSGIFEAGDTQAFIDALQRYLPLAADYSSRDNVRLKLKHESTGTAAATPES